MEDIENASLVLIVGSNTAESHPVLASRVKRAQKLRGQKLIVADLREHEMARRADIFLHPKPGTDLVWLSAISRYVIDTGIARTEFLQKWVHGFEEYKKSLAPFALEFASKTCGLATKTIENVARTSSTRPRSGSRAPMGFLPAGFPPREPTRDSPSRELDSSGPWRKGAQLPSPVLRL